MVRSLFRKILAYFSSEDDTDVESERAHVQYSENRQHRKFIRRNHNQGHECLFRDYFAENPVYSSNLFRKRFRMSRPLFIQILNDVESYEPFFVQKRDNCGRLGLFSIQKITAALRMLACGVTGDFMDEYIRIGETTAMESLKKFTETLVNVFSGEYLRSPNANDIFRLLNVAEQRGFPGMLGTLTACTGNGKTVNGKTVRRPGKVCTLAMYENQLLFWKQLLHTISGRGVNESSRAEL